MSGAAPFVEDTPFQRIVSITMNIRGATFVVKTAFGEIFYGRALGSAGQSREWLQWSKQWEIIGGTHSNSGSSSALVKMNDADPGKPVWVVSSDIARDDTSPDAQGSVILYSEDGGATWEKVFEQRDNNDGDERVPWLTEPTGIVWDEDQKAFFASFWFADWFFREGDIEISEGEAIYRSLDGRGWSLVSRNAHLPHIPDPPPQPSDIFPYCNKPENQNRGGSSDGKIPDGLQGYNSNTGTFIRPTTLLGFDPWNGAAYSGPDPSITRIDDKGVTTIRPTNVVNCYAVTFHGGVWIAVGGGDPHDTLHRGGTYIDVSFDDGQTWENVFQNPDTTFAGATVSGQGAINP